jgi:hypothetical protein
VQNIAGDHQLHSDREPPGLPSDLVRGELCGAVADEASTDTSLRAQGDPLGQALARAVLDGIDDLLNRVRQAELADQKHGALDEKPGQRSRLVKVHAEVVCCSRLRREQI